MSYTHSFHVHVVTDDDSLHKLGMMYSIVYTKLSFSLLSQCNLMPPVKYPAKYIALL